LPREAINKLTDRDIAGICTIRDDDDLVVVIVRMSLVLDSDLVKDNLVFFEFVIGDEPSAGSEIGCSVLATVAELSVPDNDAVSGALTSW